MPFVPSIPLLRIGDLTLATNLLLAPMAGYCDVSFRLVARSCGAVGLACTDLLSPEGVLRQTKRTMELAATCPEDSPLAVQLYGCESDRLDDAARWAEDRGAHVVDINMGCPVDKVTKLNGGAKLLCDPDRTLRMVQRIRAVLKHTPLTVKLRLGWDEEHIVAPSMAAKLEEAGVALITIHGRTARMRFSGQASLDGIGAVVAAVKRIPVIGNGDVRSPEDALRMIQRTGCAGVMIGREALSMPWIFRDVWSYLTTGVIPSPPTLRQKCQFMRDHFYNLARFRNERVAVTQFRQQVSWYAKQMTPCRILRDQMRLIDSAGDFELALERFLEWRGEQQTRCATKAGGV